MTRFKFVLAVSAMLYVLFSSAVTPASISVVSDAADWVASTVVDDDTPCCKAP